MTRRVAVALLLLGSSPATAQVTDTGSWRIGEMRGTAATPAWQLPATKIGTRGRLGIGMFGLKSPPPHSRSVTVREMDEPKRRRAGVGFSLKF